LTHFLKDPLIHGAENLRAEGPLLITSNHPGAYDVLLIGSTLGRRDLRIVTSTVPLYHVMMNFHKHTIEVGTTPEGGMRSIRESVRHVRNGGALLIFPSGLVDPDADVLPGAREALATWRPGVEALVNLAPRAAVVQAIAGGVLAPRWINNPLLRLQKVEWQRRKLAEMLQVVQQTVWPQTEKLSPRLTFGPPTSGEELHQQAGGSKAVLPLLIERGQALLSRHMSPLRDGRCPGDEKAPRGHSTPGRMSYRPVAAGVSTPRPVAGPSPARPTCSPRPGAGSVPPASSPNSPAPAY
jgi:hypothetical protein